MLMKLLSHTTPLVNISGHMQLEPLMMARIALDDPLWDGDGCAPDNSCCNQTGMLPWFYRNLPQEVGDDIEVRLCGSESHANEEAYVELVEIYVQ